MHRRDFVIRSAQAAAAFGILRQVGACAPSQAPAGDAAFLAIRDHYFLKFLELNPVTSTYLGGDGYSSTLAQVNGRLRDWSAVGMEVEQAFHREIMSNLAELDPARLSPSAAIDYRVVQAQIGFLLHQHDRGYHQRAVDTYVAEPFSGVDWQMQQMQSFDSGMLGTEDEWTLVAERVEAIPAYVAVARANLEAGKTHGNLPDRRLVQEDGIAGARANATYFRTTLGNSAKEYLGPRPFARTMLDRLATAGAAAADAWAGFVTFLQQAYDPKETTDRFMTGEEEYDWRLRNCLRVPRTAAELWEYGGRQVSLYEEKMFVVAQEVATGLKLTLPFDADADKRASVRRVIDALAKDSPRNDDELFAWYREAGERAVAYGRAQQMFDIPADYRLDVVPLPPVLGSSGDATYYPAPPFKKSGVGRFYLPPTGNDPGALRLRNRASVADTAVHEGFPGHDWDYRYMTQHAAEISNVRWLTPGAVEDSSSMWEDSMATEGWALYAEDLMAEPAPDKPHGFYTAAEHLYELQGQLRRAVRVRVDVGIHTGRMTFDEAADFFAEHAHFYSGACRAAAGNADARAVCETSSQAIYRYSKWPTQAITYNLGKNEIIALRDAWKEKKGAAFTARDFHERFMRQGTIPVGYFREAFLGQA